MEKEVNTFSHCKMPEIVEVESDILIIGGGMAACGAAYETCRWASPKNLKVVLVDKAALDRSGAVSMGLSAINTYLGLNAGENTVEDYVKYVRGDLMGITREDIVYDIGRHVDDSVHLFDEWGLPIWKAEGDEGKKLGEGAKCTRSGRWQAMISGESYKVIVAEAAKKALEYNREKTGMKENLYERVFITRLILDEKEDNRISGAIGISVRENQFYLFKANAILNACGGGVNTYRPRSTDEGLGRTWYPVWNSSSTTTMGVQVGAELTLMENVFVPTRFKDGYGPVGTFFLHLKCKATNGLNENYIKRDTIAQYAPYCDLAPVPTCLRNHQMFEEIKNGRGPILMHTAEPILAMREKDKKKAKKLESDAWEDFLDMTIGQANVWASNNIAPEEKPSEIIPTEPYFIGSHAACSGFWVSGPSDVIEAVGAPKEWDWGYNRMTTVKGLFTAGDGVGASGHKFSSGSHADGRIAGKSMVAFVLDNAGHKPNIDTPAKEFAAELYLPFEIFQKHRNYSTAEDINPNYIRPKQLQARLMKLMDEYAGGVSSWYITSKPLMDAGLEKLQMVREDLDHLAAENLHELLRCWEMVHRTWTAEAHVKHMLFREETRYPGYYYRADFPKIDDENWKCFVNSKYDPKTGKWNVFKRDYKQIFPD